MNNIQIILLGEILGQNVPFPIYSNACRYFLDPGRRFFNLAWKRVVEYIETWNVLTIVISLDKKIKRSLFIRIYKFVHINTLF